MSKKNDSDKPKTMNRRKILGALGGGAAGIVGPGLGVKKVSASPSKRATGRDVKNALSDPKVQSILDALGSPRIITKRAATQSTDVGELSMEVTHVPTSVGDIVYGIRNDDKTEAQFYFSNLRNEANLPNRYQGLPNRESAILSGLDDEAVLTRLATIEELTAMSNELGFDKSDAVAGISSRENTFLLKYSDSNGDLQKYEVSGGTLFHESDTTEFSYHHVDSTKDDMGEISPSAIDNCNEDWCWRCLQATGACGACVMACEVVGPGCALCLGAACGGTGYACTACIDCS